MFSLTNFTIDSCSNADSLLEKAADFILIPTRNLFSGKNFVHLKNDQDSIRFEIPNRASFEKPMHPMLRLAITIGDIAGLILVPIGLLLKTAAYISNESTNNTYSNWVDPIQFSEKKQTEVPVYSVMGEENSYDRMCRERDESEAKEMAFCEKIDNIYRNCKESNLEKEFYFHCIENPNNYLAVGEENLYFSPLRLLECGCGESNRLMNGRRIEIEKRISSDFKSTYQKLDEPINLMSLGAGGLLQDWILLGNLIKQGFTNINYIVVEPSTYKSASKALKSFTQFFKNLNGVEVNISSYKCVEDYKAKNADKNLNAVFAIDFDELDTKPGCWSDVNAVRDMLVQDKGKLYMSYAQDDMVIDEKNNLELYGRKGVYNFINNDLKNFNIPKGSISIAASTTDESKKDTSKVLACKLGVPIIFYLQSNCKDPLEINLLIQGTADDRLKSDFESFSDGHLNINVSFVDEIETQKFDLIITAKEKIMPDDLKNPNNINVDSGKISLSENTNSWLSENGVAYKIGFGAGKKLERITTNGNNLLNIEG